MEFKTITFKKDIEQPPTGNSGRIYSLLSVIFLLLVYLFSEAGVEGWLVGVLVFSALICSYLIRYHKWGKREHISGHFDKELIITPGFIKVDGSTIKIESIEKIKFDIDRYDNQTFSNYYNIRKSDGISNRISITTNGKTFTELFRIGTELHMLELKKVINQLKKNAVNVEINYLSQQ